MLNNGERMMLDARADPLILPAMKKNANGSIDLYLGPKAPAGKDPNWIPTDAKSRFEALFRFYGPDKPPFRQDVGPAGHRKSELTVKSVRS